MHIKKAEPILWVRTHFRRALRVVFFRLGIPIRMTPIKVGIAGGEGIAENEKFDKKPLLDKLLFADDLFVCLDSPQCPPAPVDHLAATRHLRLKQHAHRWQPLVILANRLRHPDQKKPHSGSYSQPEFFPPRE
jgi:hypothetical protein